ncbi:MAG: hypothetical protein ACM30E_01120, partial [Nitrososphaerales archaeon]
MKTRALLAVFAVALSAVPVSAGTPALLHASTTESVVVAAPAAPKPTKTQRPTNTPRPTDTVTPTKAATATPTKTALPTDTPAPAATIVPPDTPTPSSGAQIYWGVNLGGVP